MAYIITFHVSDQLVGQYGIDASVLGIYKG